VNVKEMVRLTAKAGRGDELGPRLQRGLTVQAGDPGCVSVSLFRSVERPDEYLAELVWTSVAAHHAWRDKGRDLWRERVGWEIIEGGPQGLGHFTFVADVKTER